MAPSWDWEKEAKLASTSMQDTALCIERPRVDKSMVEQVVCLHKQEEWEAGSAVTGQHCCENQMHC